MERLAIGALATLPLVLGGLGNANAGKRSDPWCSISPSQASVGPVYVVHAENRPILEPINLWVTSPDGTVVGSPLGSTPDGTFSLDEVSNTAGVWTYTFSGVVRAKGYMKVYAICSMQAY